VLERTILPLAFRRVAPRQCTTCTSIISTRGFRVEVVEIAKHVAAEKLPWKYGAGGTLDLPWHAAVKRITRKICVKS